MPLLFLGTNPHFVWNLNGLWSGMQDQIRRYHDGHYGAEPNDVFLFNLKNFLFTSYGLLGAILFILGWVYLIRRKKYHTALFLSIIPLAILITLSGYKVAFERNLVMAMPYFYLIASLSLYFWEGRFRLANISGGVVLILFLCAAFNYKLILL